MVNVRKKLKRKKGWIDYRKKRNILRNWERQQKRRKREGLEQKRMPVQFPKSRKFTPPKNNDK